MARPRGYCPVSMVWRAFTSVMMILWLVALLPGTAVHAEPATDAVIAEVGTALDKGEAAQALQLADGGLKTADNTMLQRSRLLLDRGLAHELLGANQEALRDFTGALQARALPSAEHAQALLQRGFLLDGMGQLDDAAKDYTSVIALKGDLLATALNNRANIWRRQNRFSEAKRDYQAALAAGSAKPQFPYYGLGQIAEAQHDGDTARGFYAKALAADPGYSLAADQLAALGGPPEGALAEPDRIMLHPPAAKPESPAPRDDAVNLHPSPVRRVAKLAKASTEPGLRPALDGPSTGTEPEVQLGAWRSEPEAQAGWQKVREKAGSAVDGLSAHVVLADLPGRGRYFRLRVATPNPKALCAALRNAGIDCALTRD